MNLLKESIKQFLQYKEYFVYTVKSNLKANLQGSYLGYLWWLLDPFMFMLVYVFMVSIIFGRGGPDFPVIVFTGTLSWKWTTTTVMQSASSIKGKAGVLKQIYLPKFLLPLISVATNSAYYIFGLIVLIPMVLFFDIQLTFHLFEFIFVFAVQFVFLSAISLFLAHAGVFFGDLPNILQFTVRFWFFLTPIMYTLEDVPQQLEKFYFLNPMVIIIESYRDVIMYGRSPNYKVLLIWTVLSLIVIYWGLSLIRKNDKNYTRVI